MKWIKSIAISLVIFLVVLLVISFFLSSRVHVERRITINAPAAKVFEQIDTVRNWEKWSPWHKLDPNMKLQYEGPPSGAGAKYTWQSEQRNVGNGSLTITQSTTNEVIQTSMDFGGQGRATGRFQLATAPGGTEVTWSMDTEMGNNPVAKFFGVLMEKMVGRDFEKGLDNLKAICEAK